MLAHVAASDGEAAVTPTPRPGRDVGHRGRTDAVSG